eukprot:Phypoly_transcript_10647.p1 GENE.Phypoly_transcript_10647~~Phypoly_transcript_10647.p1  ORF type:complete len:339 (+),score=28.35 Phypoly_transcript_10647:226-1242(+)
MPLQTSNNVFHGLWAQDYHALLQFLSSNGFNAIRVPFYLDLVLNDAQPNSINFYQMNTDLQGLTSLQVLDKVIEAAADLGLLIMLDLHSFEAGTFMQDGLWYDSTHPEPLVLQGWDKLINRYANQWNVIAFDLKNEPFSTTWGGPNTTDWSAGSTRIANHILSNTNGSRFLVFVEGTATSPPCAQNCFWGENLQGPLTNPLSISNQKKLVYSPHCYGPSVSYQPYFNDPTFPANMPAIWDAHWGTVNQKTGQAVVLGEWGGQLDNPDGTWLNAFVKYLSQHGLTSQFFWCLNPDSGDTGGLLADDWKTPVTGKLTLLQQLDPNPAVFSYKNGQYCVTV